MARKALKRRNCTGVAHLPQVLGNEDAILRTCVLHQRQQTGDVSPGGEGVDLVSSQRRNRLRSGLLDIFSAGQRRGMRFQWGRLRSAVTMPQCPTQRHGEKDKRRHRGLKGRLSEEFDCPGGGGLAVQVTRLRLSLSQ